MSTSASPATRSRNCGTCTKGSDNKHFDCPPRMADGRLFTDYRPRCDTNYWAAAAERMAYAKSSNSSASSKTKASQAMMTRPPADSYTYRQYMIANADALMASERGAAYAAASCAPCSAPFDQAGTMLPERDMEVCDARTCRRVPGPDPVNGLGTGRSYGIDPEARARLGRSQAQLNAKVVAGANCCATPFDVQNYYPVDLTGSQDHGQGQEGVNASVMRLTVPGGSLGSSLQGGDPSVAPHY